MIVAGISFLGHLGLSAGRLHVSGVDAPVEHVHLVAGVVDVVFALYVVTRRFEYAGKRASEHRAAAMSDVDRPRRVDADELYLDASTLPIIHATVCVA